MNRPVWSILNDAVIKDCFLKMGQLEADRLNSSSSKWSYSESSKPINRPRNRYVDIFPFNRNRVKLKVKSNGSDYINASHIKINDDKTYIAAQGPLEETIHHFWAMSYSEAAKNLEDSILIVMMTPIIENGVVKCSQYWPSLGETFDFTEDIIDDNIDLPDLSITNDKETQVNDYTLTELTLTSNSQSKKVYHYYYSTWADSRVPKSGDSLVSLLNDINRVTEECQVSTPIIHCSAGVGRTGTFIALDYLNNHQQLLLLNKSSTDPIFEVFKDLRHDRRMMIQTVHQYRFLYDYFKKRLA